MLACKGIFAKPSISQVRIAHGGAAAKAYAVRLSENIISRFTTKVNAFFCKSEKYKIVAYSTSSTTVSGGTSSLSGWRYSSRIYLSALAK